MKLKPWNALDPYENKMEGQFIGRKNGTKEKALSK